MTEFRFTTWVHGNAVVPQFVGGPAVGGRARFDKVDDIAWTDIVGYRIGPGVTFRGAGAGFAADDENTNYFHVSIPTISSMPAFFPVAQQGQEGPHFYRLAPVQLAAVQLKFSVDSGVRLMKALMFDGGDSCIAIIDGAGPRWGVPLTTLVTGLGVSFEVSFPPNQANITFMAVGAEWVVDLP